MNKSFAVAGIDRLRTSQRSRNARSSWYKLAESLFHARRLGADEDELREAMVYLVNSARGLMQNWVDLLVDLQQRYPFVKKYFDAI